MHLKKLLFFVLVVALLIKADHSSPVSIQKKAIIFCIVNDDGHVSGYSHQPILNHQRVMISKDNNISDVLNNLSQVADPKSQVKPYHIEGFYLGTKTSLPSIPKFLTINIRHMSQSPSHTIEVKREWVFSSVIKKANSNPKVQIIYFYYFDNFKIPDKFLNHKNIVQIKLFPSSNIVVKSPEKAQLKNTKIPERKLVPVDLNDDSFGADSEVGFHSDDESDSGYLSEDSDLGSTRLHNYPATVSKNFRVSAYSPNNFKRVITPIVTANAMLNPYKSQAKKVRFNDNLYKMAYDSSLSVQELKQKGLESHSNKIKNEEKAKISDLASNFQQPLNERVRKVSAPVAYRTGLPPKKVYALKQGKNQSSIFSLAHALLDDLIVTADIEDASAAENMLDQSFISLRQYLKQDQSVAKSITAADYLTANGNDILEFNKFLAKSELLRDKGIMPAMTEEMLAFILKEFFVNSASYDLAMTKFNKGFVEFITTTTGYSFKFNHKNSGDNLQNLSELLVQNFFSTADKNGQLQLINNVKLSLKRLFDQKKLVAIVYSQSRGHFYEVSVDITREGSIILRDSLNPQNKEIENLSSNMKRSLAEVFIKLKPLSIIDNYNLELKPIATANAMHQPHNSQAKIFDLASNFQQPLNKRVQKVSAYRTGLHTKKVYALKQGSNECSIFALSHALLDDVIVTPDIQNIDTTKAFLDQSFNSLKQYLNQDEAFSQNTTLDSYLRMHGVDILEFNKFLSKSGLIKEKGIMPPIREEMLAFILNKFFVESVDYDLAMRKFNDGYIKIINKTPGLSATATHSFEFYENQSTSEHQRLKDVLIQHFFSMTEENAQIQLINNVKLSLKRLFDEKKFVAIVYSQSRGHFYEVSINLERDEKIIVRDSLHPDQNALNPLENGHLLIFEELENVLRKVLAKLENSKKAFVRSGLVIQNKFRSGYTK